MKILTMDLVYITEQIKKIQDGYLTMLEVSKKQIVFTVS